MALTWGLSAEPPHLPPEHYSSLSPPCGKKPQGTTKLCHPGLLWPDLSGSFSYWKAKVLWLLICLCMYPRLWGKWGGQSSSCPAQHSAWFLLQKIITFSVYISHIKHAEWGKLRVIKAAIPNRRGSGEAWSTSIHGMMHKHPQELRESASGNHLKLLRGPRSHLLHWLEWNGVFHEMKGKVSESSGNALQIYKLGCCKEKWNILSPLTDGRYEIHQRKLENFHHLCS